MYMEMELTIFFIFLIQQEEMHCEQYETSLRKNYPEVAWNAKVSDGMDVATYVSRYICKIWEYIASPISGIPREVITELAYAGLRDSLLPYKRKKLIQYAPCLKLAYLDELLGWQSDALALHSVPTRIEHR